MRKNLCALSTLRTAFSATRVLPSRVLGPVHFRALARSGTRQASLRVGTSRSDINPSVIVSAPHPRSEPILSETDSNIWLPFCQHVIITRLLGRLMASVEAFEGFVNLQHLVLTARYGQCRQSHPVGAQLLADHVAQPAQTAFADICRKAVEITLPYVGALLAEVSQPLMDGRLAIGKADREGSHFLMNVPRSKITFGLEGFECQVQNTGVEHRSQIAPSF
jgi:hypothetical protein